MHKARMDKHQGRFSKALIAARSASCNAILPCDAKQAGLKQIVLFFEDRESWIKTATKQGFSCQWAEEASNWLLEKSDIRGIYDSLVQLVASSGIDVQLISLNRSAE